MINVWAGEAAMSRVAAECAGRRPVSVNGHPTEGISEFVSFLLNPLVQLLPTTTHLLNILKDIDVLPNNAVLVPLTFLLYTQTFQKTKESTYAE